MKILHRLSLAAKGKFDAKEVAAAVVRPSAQLTAWEEEESESGKTAFIGRVAENVRKWTLLNPRSVMSTLGEAYASRDA